MVISDKRIDFFDYLRALAVSLVALTHYRNSFMPGGSIGVSIFFCLSGYLITTILLTEDKLTPRKALAFMLRRFMRVFPAYLCALATMLALMTLAHSNREPLLLAALPGLLTFTQMPQQWIGMETGVFWTLHVEFWFYILMPILLLAFGKGRALLVSVLVLILISYAFKFPPMFHISVPQIWPIAPLLFWMDNLFYGSIVAILYFHRKLRLPGAVRLPVILTSLVVLVFVAMNISAANGRTVWPSLSTGASLLAATLIAVYLSNDAELPAFPRWVWLGTFIAWIGRISYSIYLLHGIPLDYRNILTKPLFNLSQVGILLLAAASYYFVEKPGIRLGRNLTKYLLPAAKKAVQVAKHA